MKIGDWVKIGCPESVIPLDNVSFFEQDIFSVIEYKYILQTIREKYLKKEEKIEIPFFPESMMDTDGAKIVCFFSKENLASVYDNNTLFIYLTNYIY